MENGVVGYRDLKYFEYQHLPDKLQFVSKKFHDLAYTITYQGEKDLEEMKLALHFLKLAKDAAVRAYI